MNPKINDFFRQYESANSNFDVAKISSFYADVFMFCSPQGVQAVKKEDFVKVLPRRKEFFKSVGLKASTVKRIEVFELDSQYVLAKVVWKMQIVRSGREPVESENASSYVLVNSRDSFQIVFQVDHQDLAKKIQELG